MLIVLAMLHQISDIAIQIRCDYISTILKRVAVAKLIVNGARCTHCPCSCSGVDCVGNQAIRRPAGDEPSSGPLKWYVEKAIEVL